MDNVAEGRERGRGEGGHGDRDAAAQMAKSSCGRRGRIDAPGTAPGRPAPGGPDVLSGATTRPRGRRRTPGPGEARTASREAGRRDGGRAGSVRGLGPVRYRLPRR